MIAYDCVCEHPSQVGYRPSYDLASELQVHLCYASEGPMKLASSLLSAKLKAMASGDAAGANDCLKQVRNACS
jgi:hypothetical protein